MKMPKDRKFIKMFVLPVAVITGLSIFNVFYIRGVLVETAMGQRDAVAYLAAQILQERFDRFVDVGISLTTRARFRELIQEGRWQEAIDVLEELNFNNAEIERVFITDPDGVLMADLPALRGVRGANFASRDWYKGVSSEWTPYVSEVYRRTAKPQHNVVAIAVPIKTQQGEVIGIFVIQLRLEVFSEWSRNIQVGESGFVYFVDKNGHVAGHPKYPPQDEIVDFSEVPVVQKVMAGESGIGTFYNPVEKEERLSAYKAVITPAYKWGVVVQQPVSEAFHQVSIAILILAISYFIALVAYLLIAIFIYKTRDSK